MHLRLSVCAAFAGALLVLGLGSANVRAQAECQRLYSSCQDYCHYGLGPSFGGSDCKQDCRDQLNACRYAGSGYPIPPKRSSRSRGFDRGYYGAAPVARPPTAPVAGGAEEDSAPARQVAPAAPVYGGWGYRAPYYGGYRPPVYGYPGAVYQAAPAEEPAPAYDLPE